MSDNNVHIDPTPAPAPTPAPSAITTDQVKTWVGYAQSGLSVASTFAGLVPVAAVKAVVTEAQTIVNWAAPTVESQQFVNVLNFAIDAFNHAKASAAKVVRAA